MFPIDLATFLQSEVDLRYVGDIEISREALLEDLKMQVGCSLRFIYPAVPF